jgi:thiamine biosynthesis protein ThiI
MEQIAQRCPEEYTTILVRRGMVRLANLIASENDCAMLITGESLGQVASQTAESIVVVDQAADRPVMRPLIAMDKVDIMETARQIGTYETSILPYDDCCSVFLPKRPATKPALEHVLSAEALLDEETWMRQALESLETEAIRPRDEL